MITNESVQGLAVDTFKEFVLLDDIEMGTVTSLTVDQALTLANRLIRAANKAAQHAH